ncbi:protein GLE1 [Canna indica]|uniref:mRNA export factor GLE1 n=1 Tax=Canna indica TaxID=4628 RepID=A0AAQ3KXF1_9LILI|nr:protein GLE1 [Canna indica]
MRCSPQAKQSTLGDLRQKTLSMAETQSTIGSNLNWDRSKGFAVSPARSHFVQLEPPCCKSSFVVPSVDPEPLWTVDDLMAKLKALELKLGSPAAPSLAPLKKLERVSPEEKIIATTDKTSSRRSLAVGWRMSAPHFDSSDSEESSDDFPIETTSYLMDKQSLENSIIFELELENQMRVKEELRCKLAELESLQRNEINGSASSNSWLAKYVEERQELDRKLDKQYRRKIAEVLDNHLSAVARDHEQRSQIEERRIRDDAALEEAKKKALLVEKLRQEKAKAEAEAKLRAAKLAEEVEMAVREAAQNAAKEAARIKEAAASEGAKKESVNHNEETKETIPVSKMSEEVQTSNGIKVLAAEAALRAEANRQKLYNEVAEKSTVISQKELDRYGRQIYKFLKQITGTVENVRAKAHALVNILQNPACPSTLSMTLFAKKVVSMFEDPIGIFNSTIFACGHVILLVSSQVPPVIDFVLAELHKCCIYTVPKYLQPSDQALQNKDYWKMVGYHEEDGKFESSESYLNRVQSYMKLYAVIVQMESDGVRNPHGLGEGWAWLARFLNTLPANRPTAYALEAFLKMAGFALHRKYKSQFMKMLNAISRSFLPALKQREDKEMNEIIIKLELYLENRMFLKEPEGRQLRSNLLSTVLS